MTILIIHGGGGQVMGQCDVFTELAYTPKKFLAQPLSALPRGTSHNKADQISFCPPGEVRLNSRLASNLRRVFIRSCGCHSRSI